MECEDFDEALSRVRQMGSLRDYQKEFKRLGNRVHGWTQKALVGTFMGGLKPEIAEGIRMFKPKSLKEAISFARIRDDQLLQQRELTRPPEFDRQQLDSPISARSNTAPTVKQLSWKKCRKDELKVCVSIAMINSSQAINAEDHNSCCLKGVPTKAVLTSQATQQRFQNMDLEDKDPVKEGCIDKPPISQLWL